MARLCDRLRIAMDMKKLKQADLSELTGIGKSSISTYLTGEYEPKQKNIYLMASALDVSEPWLMGLDVPMERKNPTADNSDGITERQREYLEKIENLSPEQLKLLDVFINGLEKQNQ